MAARMDAAVDLDTVEPFENPNNESSRNFSDGPSNNVDLSTPVVNSAVIGISSFNIALTIAVSITLYRCKKMSFQMKRLSYNVFLTDTVSNMALVFLSILAITLGNEAYGNLRQIRVCVGATGVLVSVSSIACLTLDRLVAVTKPFSYERIMNKQTVRRLTTYIWSVHIILSVSVFLVSLKLSCNLDFPRCDTLNLPFRILVAGFYVIYHMFIVASYIIISYITRHLNLRPMVEPSEISTFTKDRSQNKEHYPATNAMVKIVLIFELTNFPIFVHSVLFAFFPDLQTRILVIVFQTLSYLCMCGNLYSCFYVYVWKIKECKFVFLSTFFSWSKGCREMAERLRLDVYNIVPFVGRDKHV